MIMKEVFRRNPTDTDVAIGMFNLSLKLGYADVAANALERLEHLFPEHPNLIEMRQNLENRRDQRH